MTIVAQGRHYRRYHEVKSARGGSSRQGKAKGQGLAEYALILGLIAVLTIAALLFLGDNIQQTLSVIGTAL